jgi:hypothetical protein
VAPDDLVTPIADRAFGDVEPRRAAAQLAVVTPPAEPHAVAARARLEVFQVEAEDVVPLDHVGVALADEARRLLQQGPLVQAVAADHVPEAGGVGEGDGHDPIGLAHGVGELVAIPGHHLDVERQPPQVAEPHAPERRASARQQILLHRIRNETVGGGRHIGREAAALATAVAGGQGVRPRREPRSPPQRPGPRQRLDLEQARRPGHEGGIDQQEERREGHDRGQRGGALTAPDTDAAVGEREGQQSWRWIGAEDRGRVIAQPAASSTAAR